MKLSLRNFKNRSGGFIQEVITLILLAALICGAVYWYYSVNGQHNSLYYSDPQYDYSLAFPSSWNGYLTERRGDEELFGFNVQYLNPEFQPLFYIGITSTAVWGQSINGSGEPVGDTYLTTVNGQVFHYGIIGDQSAPTLDPQTAAIPSIIATFKAPAASQQ